jgi:hypothetical protein
MTTSHTPTPWEVCGHYIRPKRPESGIQIAEFPLFLENHKADAAHIVRCVNSHDDLVAALQEMIIQFNDISGANQKIGEKIALSNARAALAKAAANVKNWEKINPCALLQKLINA